MAPGDQALAVAFSPVTSGQNMSSTIDLIPLRKGRPHGHEDVVAHESEQHQLATELPAARLARMLGIHIKCKAGSAEHLPRSGDLRS